MNKMRLFLFIFLFGILFYTRFVNVGWGLPYPMHPDERNMAIAIQSLNCETLHATRFVLRDCLNPHFFAYGQFPLYLAYFGILIFHIISGIRLPISFEEATIALRIMSAIASMINVWILMKIIEVIIRHSGKSRIAGRIQNPHRSWSRFAPQDDVSKLFAFCLFIFSPYFIQFSHFGTTESLLMLFYSLIIFLSLRMISKKSLSQSYPSSTFYLLSSISGLALATKISSVVFLFVPTISILVSMGFFENIVFFRLGMSRSAGQGSHRSEKKYIRIIIFLFFYLFITSIISLIFSPHNFISFKDSFSSFQYESSVALGKYVAFYTKQFVDTIPVWFQMTAIFPYVLGWPQYVLFILGFFFLSWKKTQINLLRFAFLIYFIPNAFVFTKWTRFMAPIFPIMSVFVILFLHKIYMNRSQIISSLRLCSGQVTFYPLMLISILPGIAFLSIYTSPDVRFTTSDWIYKNIPANAKILSETANVIDLPIRSSFDLQSSIFNHLSSINYQYISFDFYNLDADVTLQNQLHYFLKSADYIFVPSRRIFMNHICLDDRKSKIENRRNDCKELEKQYPLLQNYYSQLFDGRLGFEEIAQFTSYPRIQLFGKTIIEFSDEQAEESWSVFDHPVIRIYKRITNNKSPFENTQGKQISNQNSNFNYSNYKTINYYLLNTTYHLLIADTREKWEKGLMYVKNKEDINGLDGMLFQFPVSEMRTFWNKNTVSDLTLYWINDGKVVGTSLLPSIEKSKNIITVSSPTGVDQVVEIVR